MTGSAGFIGSHLVDRLIKAGHNVTGIDDFSGGSRDNINPKAHTFYLDLRDAEETARIIKHIRPQLVYHLAANAAENKAQFSPIDITSRNWNTFINTLVPSIRFGMRRIVVTSSIAVYGAGQAPFSETATPHPEDLYGMSKLMMEQALKILAPIHNFEYVITRPHNVYGTRQNMTDPYRNVVTIFLNKLLRNEPYTIYGDGSMMRCFSYIDDVVEALYKAGFADVNKMTFNVGADRGYTIKELSDTIQKVTGLKLPPQYLPARPQEVHTATSDHTLAKQFLGYEDKTSLEEGIEKTWEWAKSIGAVDPIFTEVELPSDKMPANWRVK